MLYKNKKAIVCSHNSDTNIFDIIAGDTLTYLFINCLDYILKTSIDLMKNGF